MEMALRQGRKGKSVVLWIQCWSLILDMFAEVKEEECIDWENIAISIEASDRVGVEGNAA